MPEVKQAYRDLAQVWHPDHHTQNERLQRKALKKMKELSAAYDCICLYRDAMRETRSTDEKSRSNGSTETIIVCPECGTKNRARSSANRAGAKCGKCGSYFFREKQQSESEWEHRTLCGDGACTGIIDSTDRCNKCGRTYTEGVAAEKEKTERRNQQQSQRKPQTRRRKVIVLSLLGIGAFGIFLLNLNSSLYPSDGGTRLQESETSAEKGRFVNKYLPNFFSRNLTKKPDLSLPENNEYLRDLPPDPDTVTAKIEEPSRSSMPAPKPPSVTPFRRLEVPIELEPVNPNRLRTGSAPYTDGIRSGHSEIAVDNGSDTDAIVRVVRFGDGNQEKVRNFYVRSHERFTANLIPPGEYVLRVAFGKDWNPETRKFNYRRSFGETETFMVEETTWTETRDDGEVLRTRSSKLSITLHKVPHGNFQSHPISEDEFWQ